MWRPGMSPEHVATPRLNPHPLNSSFRPTYNMAATSSPPTAPNAIRKILESSFAQFRAANRSWALPSRVRKKRERPKVTTKPWHATWATSPNTSSSAATSPNWREGIQSNERHAARRHTTASNSYCPATSSTFRTAAPAATQSSSPLLIRTPTRASASSEDAHQRTASTRDFEGAVEPVSRIKIPKRLASNRRERRDTASRMRQALRRRPPVRCTAEHPARQNSIDAQLEALQAQLRNHPCHGCSDRANHMRWAERWQKLNAEIEGLRRQIARRTNTIAQVFTRIVRLLESYGYVERTEDNCR